MTAMPQYVLSSDLPVRSPLRAAITEHWLADETALVERLLGFAQGSQPHYDAVLARAAAWVRRVRGRADEQSPLDHFMQEYDLSSEEGVLLMCLAEALLRIPDAATAEKLIADKLAGADWESHVGRSDSLFVNASTWGLMLTGRIVRLPTEATHSVGAVLARLVSKSSEPIIRLAVRQAMKLMGHQFVMGRTIEEGLRHSRSKEQRAYLHSFDMLGEAALTEADAQRYLRSYQGAIAAIGAAVAGSSAESVMARPGISVKLSALHPRYEFGKRERVIAELSPRLLLLAQQARAVNIGLTVDAEEADRLELSLDVIETVYRDPSLGEWAGFGFVVQAFQKRASFVLEWAEALAREVGRPLAIRLVKGAYWDTEVKRAQEQGLPGYPVFTRKASTDVSYLACARRLLAARDVIYPQFATHNAHTVAAVREMAGDETGYEFQRLHGMGEALYAEVLADLPMRCRVYSPVGSHEDLLPYLVRRLLENGANTSFVNRIFDEQVAPEILVADPRPATAPLSSTPNPALPLPAGLYADASGIARINSSGINLVDEIAAVQLAWDLHDAEATPPFTAASLLAVVASSADRPAQVVTDPADRRRRVGAWQPLELALVPAVIDAALAAQSPWNARSVDQRASLLERAADLLESRRAIALQLLVREAGKTLPDAIAEVREAVDFLRYYAAQGRRLLAQPEVLPGPTGEHNELQLHGKGVFVCISPWNFPLAIFVGQIAAALVTGNAVVAKPAEQTPLIATRMVEWLHEAGVPRAVLQTALGEGDVGAALTRDPRIAGVVFTGSVEVAQLINRGLAARPGAIATLIAETGGQNAMIVDSSALPEQVVKDAIGSAFYSAGQRCSALRVLYVQEDIADKLVHMLRGAMQELVVGDPGQLSTDIGPIIDEASRERLQGHFEQMQRGARLIAQVALPESAAQGSFFAPCAFEISGIEALDGEYFGPFLHVVRFAGEELDSVIDAINATGFGLTLGVHSRIEHTWRQVQQRARVGNCYINRGITGAVVGTQPFGGEGLSGTGPKAGGPHYLLRFVTERTLTVNTAAVGGNARLLAQSG